MYQFIRNHGVRRTLVGEAPAAAVAFLIAELFYKFHSFALECAAFLATWYVLSWALSRVTGSRRTAAAAGGVGDAGPGARP